MLIPFDVFKMLWEIIKEILENVSWLISLVECISAWLLGSRCLVHIQL